MTMKLGLSLFVTVFLSSSAYAFQDDYVWQDRFKKQIVMAEKGNANAQYDIGEMYEKGSGVATDARKAFEWFERSAKQGHVKAQFKVAYMYYKGQGVAANAAKAYDLIEKPANDGNVRAQYYLAEMYAKGNGVAQDLEEAFSWYSRSALGGYQPADEALAELKKVIAEKARKEQEAAAKVARAAPDKPVVAKPASPIAAPVPAPAPAPAPETHQLADAAGMQPAVARMQPTTATLLLNGTWSSLAKTPSEYLPSKITSCQKTSESTIECLSTEMQRKIGATEIVYLTKAIVYAMKKDGNFKVAYRNNVTKINANAPKPQAEETAEAEGGASSAEGGGAAAIELGWQETEHRLDCKIDGNDTVNCVKNKTQKVTLKSQTMS
jgi:hypothetical protein